MEIVNIKDNQIETLASLAKEIWFECYSEILSKEQIVYMTDLFLSRDAIMDNIQKDHYLYRCLFDKDRMIGFTASKKDGDKIFLSKLYLHSDYRKSGLGKKLFEDCLKQYDLHEVYLTVNKYNPTYNMYKHLGFVVTDSVVSDIGSGYVMDDYIMNLKF